MTNGDKLRALSELEMLAIMNANIRTCVFAYPCVMNALGLSIERYKICEEHEADCGKCIEDWLNKESEQ